jgi:hypothetical protein
MIAKFDTRKFEKTMDNIVEYSFGFLDGANKGKTVFLDNLGKNTIEALKAFVDANAKMDQKAFHHVYEWGKTGMVSGRLFNITHTVSNLGLSIKSDFKQSTSIKQGSLVPFYNKARIMEYGTPVVIKPRNASVLSFDIGGEQIFTKNPVNVSNPGGDWVQGSYEKTFNNFMDNYFKQSFLRASGVLDYLSKPKIYKDNIRSGSKVGKSRGQEIGYRWITNVKVGVE